MNNLFLYLAVVAGFYFLHRLTISPKLQAERRKCRVEPQWIFLCMPAIAASLVVSLLDVPHSAGSLGFVLLIAGGLLNWWAAISNPYFLASIRVVEGQRPIANGPYAVIRHPGYLGFTAMIVSLPVCLSSYWGLIPLTVVLWFFYRRILREEAYLRSNLVGYEEYTRMVHWRVFYGVW